MQLGLAGAIAADRVDVLAGADVIVGQHRRVMLVGGHGGDDVDALDRLLDAGTDRQVEAVAGEIDGAFLARPAVDVVEAQAIDSDERLEAERLELRLGAVADDRHRPRPGPGEMFRRDRRGRRGSQRGEDGHLAEQLGIAGAHLGEQAEGGDGLAALAHVLGMAVDVFEAVGDAVAGRHQFDHPFGRMGGQPRRSSRTPASGGNPPPQSRRARPESARRRSR